MPTPIVENIATEILARLQTIAGATVERPNKKRTSAEDGLILLQQEDAEVEQIIPGNPAIIEWRQQFTITRFFNPSDKVTTPIDTLVNAGRSEIEYAITNPSVSPALWHRFGGNAVNADWGNVDRGMTLKAMDVIALHLDVIYRVSENDPYTAR